MNPQPPRRSVLHILLSTLTGKVPKQVTQLAKPSQHPTTMDRNAWHMHWQAQGQPWRTEPEIDEKRQKFLAQRRITQPDTKHGLYPFKDNKLSRADVEWLLATLDGRGPIDWSDESQRQREGLDLRGADLSYVDLHGLPLARTHIGLAWNTTTSDWLEEASLHQSLPRTHLVEANFNEAHLEGANLARAFLKRAYFVLAHLEEANLSGTHLQGACLIDTHLQKANLTGAHLEGAMLVGTRLEHAILCRAYFDSTTRLDNIVLGEVKHGSASLADIHWGDANLTSVNWLQIQILGDEHKARQKKCDGKVKNKETRLDEYRVAVRANRQLAVALQEQGLNENAAHFAYHAQVLQKTVSWLQILQPGIKLIQKVQALGAWFFSWFLFLLAGYGYKPGRSFLAYLLVIGTFAALYLFFNPQLAWYEAIVVSMTAFHGRGFSPSAFSPGDPLSIASAVEAFVGLIIEVTFIATLTRRFFGQ